MGYEPITLFCRDREHGELEFESNGDYTCPVCGLSYQDDDFDDNDEKK